MGADASNLARERDLREKLLRVSDKDFYAYDANGDGRVDPEELRKGLRKAGINLDVGQCEEVIAEADHDGDGCVSFEEYRESLLRLRAREHELDAASRPRPAKAGPKDLALLGRTSATCARKTERVVGASIQLREFNGAISALAAALRMRKGRQEECTSRRNSTLGNIESLQTATNIAMEEWKSAAASWALLPATLA